MEKRTMTDKWVRCPECGHKVFKLEQVTGRVVVECKCHSCKAISKIVINDEERRTQGDIITCANMKDAVETQLALAKFGYDTSAYQTISSEVIVKVGEHSGSISK